MRGAHVTVEPWDEPCSGCEKPAFESLLDEAGLCGYCGERGSIDFQRLRQEEDQ